MSKGKEKTKAPAPKASKRALLNGIRLTKEETDELFESARKDMAALARSKDPLTEILREAKVQRIARELMAELLESKHARSPDEAESMALEVLVETMRNDEEFAADLAEEDLSKKAVARAWRAAQREASPEEERSGERRKATRASTRAPSPKTSSEEEESLDAILNGGSGS